MDAQASLRLCCLQTPEDRFSRVEAHLILDVPQRFTADNVFIFVPDLTS